jgi:PTS system ascorbate-specific IIB component
MRILISGTSLMMMRSAEKAMKELKVPITKIHHCAISEGKSSATQYDVVFTPVNFLNMFTQAEKKGVTVIGIKNVMSAKEIGEKFAESELYKNMK